MKRDELTRRRVLKNLMQLSAALAGLGAAKVSPLFAQTRLSNAELEAAAGIGAQSDRAKAIKALLFPRDEVFRSEFGRLPTGLEDDPYGGEKCDLFIQSPTSACTGMSESLVGCRNNTCSVQPCSELKKCPKNNCGEQTRGGVSEPSLFSSGVLSEIMGDPFIKALCKALKVTTAQDLGSKLKGLLL